MAKDAKFDTEGFKNVPELRELGGLRGITGPNKYGPRSARGLGRATGFGVRNR
jgi:hypothetical protein